MRCRYGSKEGLIEPDWLDCWLGKRTRWRDGERRAVRVVWLANDARGLLAGQNSG